MIELDLNVPLPRKQGHIAPGFGAAPIAVNVARLGLVAALQVLSLGVVVGAVVHEASSNPNSITGTGVPASAHFARLGAPAGCSTSMATSV